MAEILITTLYHSPGAAHDFWYEDDVAKEVGGIKVVERWKFTEEYSWALTAKENRLCCLLTNFLVCLHLLMGVYMLSINGTHSSVEHPARIFFVAHAAFIDWHIRCRFAANGRS